jgi:hypothetical protein
MIKKLTVNGITETISNAELHVEEENEKEGVLVFNGEVFGENIEKISRIKIGDKFYALSSASEEAKEPMAVPTEGLIEKIYFNTELSTQEVCEILGPHKNNCERHVIFGNADNESETTVEVDFFYDGIVIVKVVDKQPEIILFSSCDTNSDFATSNGINFIGWNPDFSACLELNLENQISGGTNSPGVGDLNNLTILFSMTPAFGEAADVPSSGVELFNIAELVNINDGWNTVHYGTDDGDYYREYVCNESGRGQMILDAFNAGKKIVYIGSTSSWTGNACSFCQEAFYVGDLDTFNESNSQPNFQYVVVLFHGIEWSSGNDAQMYKPRIHMFKFPK